MVSLLVVLYLLAGFNLAFAYTEGFMVLPSWPRSLRIVAASLFWPLHALAVLVATIYDAVPR